MDQPPEIAFDNIEPSEALREKIRHRLERLEQFFNHINSVHVTVSSPHKSQVHNLEYHVRIEVRVPDDELVVSRDPGDRGAHFDPYVTVRDAFDAMEKQLEAHSQKVRPQDVKHHEIPPQGRIRRLFHDHGFVETTDGREIYFHRNAVVEGAFDDLEAGQPVEMALVHGESPAGPQASTVRPIRETELIPQPEQQAR